VGVIHTRGIEIFSAKENFRKILKVSHLYLDFHQTKTIMKLNILKGFHQNFLDPDLEDSNETLYETEKSDETLCECLVLLWFSFHENPE